MPLMSVGGLMKFHIRHLTVIINKFSVNVWCSIVSDIIGPHMFEDCFNGDIYVRLLMNQLQLPDFPLATRKRVVFQHDGTPPYSTKYGRLYLHNTECCVGMVLPFQSGKVGAHAVVAHSHNVLRN